MENIRKAMEEMVDLAKSKNYSKEAARIIGTIVCSTAAKNCGYSTMEGLNLGIEQIKKYDDERDCINALIKLIK